MRMDDVMKFIINYRVEIEADDQIGAICTFFESTPQGGDLRVCRSDVCNTGFEELGCDFRRVLDRHMEDLYESK